MNRLVTKRKIEFERELSTLDATTVFARLPTKCLLNNQKGYTSSKEGLYSCRGIYSWNCVHNILEEGYEPTAPFSPSKFNAVFPYTISTYGEGDDEMCDLYFYVPTLPLEYFIPNVINQGRAFTISMSVPNFFFKSKRILLVNKGNPNFNKNTSEAQAFSKLCQLIDEDHNYCKHIFSDPLFVQLPFACEESILVWKIQYFENRLGT
ncbi:hypothetical protein IV203_033895 [Nitzschia inconspicua]|uniref:Uncharacterized protein n=1 Tax=Nitzschia inconspicua TaxID=303405 RepID=A0A9K3M6T4_9STRA|nr:hypothetical protein IV203_033895 [Nitzschia inconspicua]